MPATKTNWAGIAGELPEQARQFAAANDFTAKPGKCLTLPAPDGKIAQVVFGLEDESSKSRDLFRPGALPGLLPPGVYRFANAPHDARLAALAFALGSYRFARYRKADRPEVRLVPLLAPTWRSSSIGGRPGTCWPTRPPVAWYRAS